MENTHLTQEETRSLLAGMGIDVPQSNTNADIESSSHSSVTDTTPDSHEEPLSLEATLQSAINPNTYSVVDVTTSRFRGAEWFDKVQDMTIILAGLGGIGSWTSFFLSRLKPKILVLYDGDDFEASNISGQFVDMEHLSMPKSYAAYDYAMKFSSYASVITHNTMYNENEEAADIMICGFDNMEARKMYYETWKHRMLRHSEDDRKDCLFIDGRLGMESMQVFTITGDSEWRMEEYEEKWLFPSSEAEQIQCSMKQTTHCAAMIGSLITSMVVNFCAKRCGNITRDLPFMISYDADLVYFRTC